LRARRREERAGIDDELEAATCAGRIAGAHGRDVAALRAVARDERAIGKPDFHRTNAVDRKRPSGDANLRAGDDAFAARRVDPADRASPFRGGGARWTAAIAHHRLP